MKSINRRYCNAAIVSALAALSLTSCSPADTSQLLGQKSINGVWIDLNDPAYMISIDSNKFKDSLYNIPLSCKMDEDKGTLTVYGVDGYPRTYDYSIDLHNTLSIDLGGVSRTMKQAESFVAESKFENNRLTKSSRTTVMFKSMNNIDTNVEVRLNDDMVFSVQWGSPETHWRVASETNLLGQYASTGYSNELLLYSFDSDGLDHMRISNDGMYLGAFPMESDNTLMTEDYRSMVELKGYLVDRIVTDPSSGTTYHFYPDNTMTVSSGEFENRYNYFINPSGLLTYSVTDGNVPPDYMYCDTKSGKMYSMVLQRDQWVDYMVMQKDQWIDPLAVVDRDHIDSSFSKSLKLPKPISPTLSKLCYRVGLDQVKRFETDAAIIAEQKLKRQELDDKWKDDEAERERLHQEFLQHVMEEEKRRQEEAEERRHQFDQDGVYYPTNPDDIDYTPDSPYLRTDGVDNTQQRPSQTNKPDSSHVIVTPATDDIGTGSIVWGDEQPNSSDDVKHPDEGKAYVQFRCNCDQCTNSSRYHLTEDNRYVALVNPKKYKVGSDLSIGSMFTVRALDGTGSVTGNTVLVYINDHVMVSSLKDGLYTVKEVNE